MDFAKSIDALKSWRKKPSDTAWPIFAALCGDLSGKDLTRVRPLTTALEDRIFRPLSHLSWWNTGTRAQLTDFTAGVRVGALLDTEYDVAWLDVAFGDDAEAARLPDATLRAFHEHCSRELGGEDPALVSRYRVALVLFVTVHGKAMDLPDLYFAGPARDETGTDHLVGVLTLRLNRAISEAAGDVKAVARYLAKLQGLARGAGAGAWKTIFGTTGDVREDFRKRMAERLGALMMLLEKTVERRASDGDELHALREAASLLIFRLMFLMELEGRRGLLYLPGERPADRLSLFELADSELARQRKESMLARLQELTEHIRYGTGGVALSGASIFANQPNDAFDARVTEWLDDFDKKARRVDADLREEWNRELAKIGSLVTGQVEVYSKEAPIASAVGLGGSEHVQRVLGDVYEQILAMVPKRERARLVLTAGKNGEKNERKALAAHYTPEGMVVEMVRPLVGVLFRDAWASSKSDSVTYRKRLLDLHVVDPAMGSAHFLTVVALEIAKELAWVDRFDKPQPDSHFEALENADPWSPLAADHAETLGRSVRQYLPEVVRRCCYGVDIKPLACELGKLALWLFTMTAEPEERPPLTFVDGNIRTGDSLIGVTWKEAVALLDEHLGWQPAGANLLFGRGITDLRQELDDLSAEMRASGEDLRGWLVKHADREKDLPRDDHLLRQRALDKLRGKMDGIRWVYDLAVLSVWYSRDALLEAVRQVASDQRMLPRDADALSWEDLMMGKGSFSAKARDVAREAVRKLAHKHRAFHWQLEFPHVMDDRRFDGAAANPPFRGDRDLRGYIGEDGVAYLRERFTKTDTVDYAGYFVLRYEQILSRAGAIATLGPNTLGQAKNRRVVLVPLLAGASSGGRFRILRAVRSRPWPGEAAVHVCMVHLVASPVGNGARLVIAEEENRPSRIDRVERISSYLDDLPETELAELPSVFEGLVFNGFFPRGDFDRPLAFLEEVPAKERGALRAYLNNDDVQQSIEPRATRLVIDFCELLDADDAGDGPTQQIAFLRRRAPFLFSEIEKSVRRDRLDLPASARNEKARKYWWRYEEERPGLRAAWAGLESVLVFGAVSKCWVPTRMPRVDADTGLGINPTHALFVVAAGGSALQALLTSFPFELHLRRSSSTLETRLRVTPTEAFPTFPLPWPAIWSKEKKRPVALPAPAALEDLLGKPMRAIEALRKSILVGKDRGRIPADRQPGGPTDLYNLFDDPNVQLDVIAQLRAHHVELTDAVLRAYGWHADGPDGPALRLNWVFDRPWIDGTTRYVPGVAGRRELVVRLAKRNARRFEEEMDLCLKYLLPMLPEAGVVESGIDRWRKDNGVGLGRQEVIAMLEHGVGAKRVKTMHRGGKLWWGR